MERIELIPGLSHCIETTAKQEFRDSVSRYIENNQEDKELEERIQLLKAFLESMDFRKLRRESEEYLLQGKTVKFIIYWQEGKPDCQMTID